jgi:hypothetical protein
VRPECAKGGATLRFYEGTVTWSREYLAYLERGSRTRMLLKNAPQTSRIFTCGDSRPDTSLLSLIDGPAGFSGDLVFDGIWDPMHGRIGLGGAVGQIELRPIRR